MTPNSPLQDHNSNKHDPPQENEDPPPRYSFTTDPPHPPQINPSPAILNIPASHILAIENADRDVNANGKTTNIISHQPPRREREKKICCCRIGSVQSKGLLLAMFLSVVV